MLNRLISSLAIALMAVPSAIDACGREVDNINYGWKFTYGDPEGAPKLSADDSGWQMVNLPHDYQVAQPWVAPSADEQGDKDNPWQTSARVSARVDSRRWARDGTDANSKPIRHGKANVCSSISAA